MSTRDFSNTQEDRVAKALGGHRTANSGATTFSKGDVLTDKFIIECKTKMTDCNSFTVQKQWIENLNRERIEMGKTASAVAISFNSGKDSYYIINEKLMQKLVRAISEEE